jgi:hypothetical protein
MASWLFKDGGQVVEMATECIYVEEWPGEYKAIHTLIWKEDDASCRDGSRWRFTVGRRSEEVYFATRRFISSSRQRRTTAEHYINFRPQWIQIFHVQQFSMCRAVPAGWACEARRHRWAYTHGEPESVHFLVRKPFESFVTELLVVPVLESGELARNQTHNIPPLIDYRGDWAEFADSRQWRL